MKSINYSKSWLVLFFSFTSQINCLRSSKSIMGFNQTTNPSMPYWYMVQVFNEPIYRDKNYMITCLKFQLWILNLGITLKSNKTKWNSIAKSAHTYYSSHSSWGNELCTCLAWLTNCTLQIRRQATETRNPFAKNVYSDINTSQ